MIVFIRDRYECMFSRISCTCVEEPEQSFELQIDLR